MQTAYLFLFVLLPDLSATTHFPKLEIIDASETSMPVDECMRLAARINATQSGPIPGTQWASCTPQYVVTGDNL